MSRRRWIGLCVLVAAAAGLTHATQVRRVNLEEMTRRAATIFSGRCTARQVDQDPTLGNVTLVTFEVERLVKGPEGSALTVRLPGTRPEVGGAAGIAGLPDFEVGEEVVLFLYAASARGMSSPVGLGQGKFQVVRDKEGKKVARNALGNEGLLRDLSPAARQKLELAAAADGAAPEETLAALAPSDLLDMAQQLVAEPQDTSGP